MRQIEFRAWDLISKEFIYLNDNLSSIPYYEIFCQTPDDRPWELMQFTGLLDKNGKKIFEMDIFENQSGKGLIEWWPEHCCLAARNIETDQMFIITSKGKTFVSEVIGNIYENPELVGGKP